MRNDMRIYLFKYVLKAAHKTRIVEYAAIKGL